jgi:CopG family transcriptional regulator/antitoxin EndoAI
MYQRINVTLPKQTIKLIDRVSKKGNRSRLIDEAVKHFIASVSRANLEKRLKEGALIRADRDLEVAEEWFSIDDNPSPESAR